MKLRQQLLRTIALLIPLILRPTLVLCVKDIVWYPNCRIFILDRVIGRKGTDRKSATERPVPSIAMSGKVPLGNKAKETDKLKQNVQEQLQRLLQQLSDLKEEAASFSPEEYAEIEKETLDQLRDFQESLKKMTEGDLTLADELSSVKLVCAARIQGNEVAHESERNFRRFSTHGSLNAGCDTDLLLLDDV